jgi:hypothetical protein
MEGNKVMEGASRVKVIEKKEVEKVKRFRNAIEQENCIRCGEIHDR